MPFSSLLNMTACFELLIKMSTLQAFCFLLTIIAQCFVISFVGLFWGGVASRPVIVVTATGAAGGGGGGPGVGFLVLSWYPRPNSRL